MHTEYVSDNDVFTPNARKKVLGNSGVEPEEADSCILEGEVTIKGVSVFRNCIPSQLTQGTTRVGTERVAIRMVRESFCSRWPQVCFLTEDS